MQLLMMKVRGDNEQCYNNWWSRNDGCDNCFTRNNNKVTLIERDEKLGKKLVQEKADVILLMRG